MQVTSDCLKVDAEDLIVRIKDNRLATITISGLSLKDRYLTNLSSSEKNASEYFWRVEMYGDQVAYSVSTPDRTDGIEDEETLEDQVELENDLSTASDAERLEEDMATSADADLAAGLLLYRVAMVSNYENFEINGTKLIKYVGTEKRVVIPDGIETIGERAFEFNKR